MLRRILEAIRRILADVIGWESGKDYVLRPWSPEEEEDFQRFCESIGQMPDDPEHAEAMQDGEVDFFNNDPFYNVKLYRA